MQIEDNFTYRYLENYEYQNKLWLPFAVLFCLCTILIFAPYELQTSLVQWILTILFYGSLTAFLVLVFGVSVQKFKWVKKLRSNMVLTSTTVCLTVFTLGVLFELLPDRSHQKYLMPNTYKVKKKKGDYSIWYYPKWNYTFCDMRVLEKYKNYLPKVTIKSIQGNSIQIDQSEHHSCWLRGKHSALRIGKIRISKSGIYDLKSHSEHDSNFVIALVKVSAEKRYSVFDPPFTGFNDEYLEKH